MEKRKVNRLVKGLVSIIVPVYNGEQYIHQCIKSIVHQNYKNIEIILINDGSTDNSGRICEEYARRDKRIKVIHKENSGPAAARNRGLEISRGELIFFIDADDFIEDNAINLLIKCYKQHKAEITVGDFKKIRKDNIEARNDICFSESKLLNKQEIINYSRCYLKKPNKYLLFAFSWARLFKNSIIKEKKIRFDENLHTFEDVAFNFDYLKYTNKVYFLKEVIYNHVVHDNYASATMAIGGNPKKLFGYEQALVNIGNFLEGNVNEKDIKKEVGHAYITLTIIQLVRTCGQINKGNRKKVFLVIRELVNSPYLRSNLKFYSPSKGESKILSFFMKLRLIWPIIWICKYKAYKRYKK